MFESQQQQQLALSGKISFQFASILPLDWKTSYKTFALSLSFPKIITLFGVGTYFLSHTKSRNSRGGNNGESQ